TLSDARGAEAAAFEYVGAQVVDGIATLERGLEGSADREWPAGSWIYCSVTADVLASVFLQLADLQLRVEALEQAQPGPEPVCFTVTAGMRDEILGYSQMWSIGCVSPAGVDVPGHGAVTVYEALAKFY